MTVQSSEERDDKMDHLDEKINKALQSERRSVGERRRQQADKRFSFTLFLAFLISSFALAISGYVFYQLYPLREWPPSVDQRLLASEAKLDTFDSLLPRLAETRKQVDGLNQEMESLTAAAIRNQEQIDKKLETALESVDQKMGATSEDWKMAEVEYLLRLANQRTILDTDITGARKLLISADNILKEAEILTAFEVRQAIAEDLVKLESVESVDHEGIYASLTAIYRLIETLQQKRQIFTEPEVVAETSGEEQLSWSDRFSSIGSKIWGNVSRLIDFRRNDAPVKPMMPPEEEYYLKQNLRLKIELARIALLRGNQLMYDQSIQESRDWIEQYFDAEHTTTLTSLTHLEELSKVTVAVQGSDVSDSLRAIRKYMERFKGNVKQKQSGFEQ